MSGLLGRIHGSYAHGRRVRRLAELLSARLPRSGRVLDVGCGDGMLAEMLQRSCNGGDLRIEGIDVLVRPDAHIPVTRFDGRQIPFDDSSFDAVLLVDVLHHADDPIQLLREVRRVTRRSVVIKDHTLTGAFAGATLRFMDRVGNARHGVALPYNYFSRAQWNRAFEEVSLEVVSWEKRLKLYPFPASAVFGRSLHFVAGLVKRA